MRLCAKIYLENNLNFAHLFQICSRAMDSSLAYAKRTTLAKWLRFGLHTDNNQPPTTDNNQQPTGNWQLPDSMTNFLPAKVARTMWD